MRTKYPELEAFADMLYENEGQTVVKMADGTWRYISVCEGFSQRCPMSHVCSALVLHEILSQIDSEM